MSMYSQGGVAPHAPNAGIDVAKQRLDVCLADQSSWQVVNDVPGWNELIAQFKAHGVDLVVVEAIRTAMTAISRRPAGQVR